MASPAVVALPRSSGGGTITFTSGPPADLPALPATLYVVRAGSVLLGLTATA
jgi:hypothetical protein